MLYLALLAIAVGFLFVERQFHLRRLRKIPLRIHVNGTRGKTTVTRLTAELLRRAGIRTCAKTTGDQPEVILPDGRCRRIRRRGSVRIQEQMAFLAEAVSEDATAVVVECMALEPSLQEASERTMVRSTIGVITNVRPDHFEVMGRSLDQVAQALSGTIPAGAVLVSETGPHEPLFRKCCEAAGSRIRLAPTNGTLRGEAALSSVLEENLSIVRAIGLQAGLSAETVDGILHEMAASARRQRLPEIGDGSRRIVFIDAFSANDVVSTARIQDEFLSLGEAACPRPVVALFNTRADRPLRTLAFAEFIAGQMHYEAIGLAGDGCFLARRRLRQQAVTGPLLTLREREPSAMLAAIARQTGAASFTLVGIGNHRGAGEALRHYFSKDVACS